MYTKCTVHNQFILYITYIGYFYKNSSMHARKQKHKKHYSDFSYRRHSLWELGKHKVYCTNICNAHFIIPYRYPMHVYIGFQYGVMNGLLHNSLVYFLEQIHSRSKINHLNITGINKVLIMFF